MPFTARYGGVCTKCGASFPPGTEIDGKPRAYSHVRCPEGAVRSASAPKAASGTWDRVPLIGTKEGATAELRRRERGGGRGYKPTLEVGRVFRAGRYAGPVAGKVVIVVGSEANYTSADWEDDCGQSGEESGWWVREHVRLATPDEAAPLMADDDDRVTLYARDAWVRAQLQARAAELHIDEAKAWTWLAKYAGCAGASL